MLSGSRYFQPTGAVGSSLRRGHTTSRGTMASVAFTRAASQRVQVHSRIVFRGKLLSHAHPVRARAFRGGSPIVMVSRVEKSDAEWKKELDQTSFQVLRKKGTEPAGTGEYDKFYPTEGHFVCKGCGNPLYSAESKFNSGCGWPAFDKCYKGALITETDMTFGMKRVGGYIFFGRGVSVPSAHRRRACLFPTPRSHLTVRRPLLRFLQRSCAPRATDTSDTSLKTRVSPRRWSATASTASA